MLKTIICLSYIIFFRKWEARLKESTYPPLMIKAWEEAGLRVGDSSLSPPYIKSLIEQSNNSYFLTKINNYLGNSKKTGNLMPEVKKDLFQQLNKKMNTVHSRELMEELMRVLKEKGVDSFL